MAAQQLFHQFGEDFLFEITQVIGLTNEDPLSAQFRPFKQVVERLNPTFKSSYRVRCGYDNLDGANYNLSLWVAYYNFLRPHKLCHGKPLNRVARFKGIDNMPGKWQMLIRLGQETILELQKHPPDE